MLKKIHRFATNPWVTVCCGIIIVATSGTEIIRTIDNPQIGAHHGIAIFGILQILQTLPDLIGGIDKTTTTES